jgi:hypothetical protein
MACGRKTAAVRRLLLLLTAIVGAAWILSFAVPWQITFRSSPHPSAGGDLSPSQECTVVEFVSERGLLKLEQGWEWTELGAAVERISLSPPHYHVGTVRETFLNRIGFEAYSGPSQWSYRGVIAPYWFLLLVSGGLYLFTLLRGRQVRRGFAVELQHVSEKGHG